ncbi:MAG: hypothetical protein U1F66_13400 [bacterium]
MKRQIRFTAVLAMALMGLVSLAACGSGKEEKPTIETDTSSKTPPAGLQPNIHENVPPPGSETPKNSEQSGLAPNTAESFFHGKEAYDNFSDSLKERIYQTYQVDPSQELGGKGNGYYNTLLGRTAPILYVKPGAAPKVRSGGNGTQMRVFALESTSAETGCDPSSTFLCLDSPENGFETVQPGVDVTGKIDLRQLAVFSATDPVIVISVFNNTGGGASAEIPIMPGDVQATSDPNVGKFSAAVGLTGAGKFTIVVSAFKVINDGAGNELFSIMVNGTRIEAPRIEFVNAVPNPLNKLADAGHETDAVQNNAVIAADFLNVKVKLLTAGGAGIQVRFDDSNENDELQSSMVALPSEEGADTFFTGVVPLHQGVNKIKVTARSPALDALLGSSAPEPSVVTFTVFNADGGPRIKLMKPAKDGVVAQTSEVGQTVDLQFCYTFIPSKTNGSAGGGSTLPSLNDTCKTGQLGFTPDVYLNGEKVVGNDVVSYDATQGTFTVKLSPRFGVNVYEIKSVDQIKPSNDQTKSTSYLAGAFSFGVPMKLIENGVVVSGDAAAHSSFTARGLNLDIDKGLVEGDIKTLLIKFLNRPQTKDLILATFRKTDNAPGYVCTETENVTTSNGDTTINFLPDSFSLGPDHPTEENPVIAVTSIETNSDGMLHLGLRINGMHGDADLRSAVNNGNTFNGKDLGFIPIRFSIARLDINVGVSFRKRSRGFSELDLRKIPDVKLIDIIGDGPLGRPLYVDSSRNPLAAGLELLDWQQGLLLTQFNNILNGTLLCGVEEGINNTTSGALGKAVVDLETKLTGYNANIFRLPFSFALLGKTVALDIGYDILKGDIRFDAEGIHIINAPLRFNPGPSALTKLASDFSDGILGAVTRWTTASEPEPQLDNTTENQKIALGIGEDALSQVFSAASLAGLIDLDVDANFYTNNKITPQKALAPMGGNDSRLAPEIDVNLDGQKDNRDKEVPLLLRVRSDKRVPPMLTFLTAAEAQELATTVVQKPAPGATPEPSPTPDSTAKKPPIVDPNGRYFRLTIPNLELAVYRAAPVPENEGGYNTYCERVIPTSYNGTLEAKGLCKVPVDSKTLVPLDKLPAGTTCPEANLVKIPARNGNIVSYEDASSGHFDNPKPLYRIKANLIVHGEIKGVKRVAAAADFLTNPNPPEKTKVQLRIVPNTLSDANPIFVTSIQVLENNTGKSDAALAGDWVTTLTGALGSPCERFNEIMIPIPEKFAGKADADGNPTPLLPDFGVDSLDIGVVDPNDPETLARIPVAYIDDSRLYLDILAYAGLNFTETGGN